jgi:hypothetical protein
MAGTDPLFARRPRSLGRGLLRALRFAGALVLGLLAVLGAATIPGHSVALGVVFATLAWALVRVLRIGPAAEQPALPHPAAAAAAVGPLPAAVAGTVTLGLGPVGVAAAVVSVAVTIGWWGASQPRPRKLAAADDAVAGDGALQDLLRIVPVDVLFAEWRDTATPGEPDATDPGAEMGFRALLVSEFRRRDPAGTDRWLSEAPDEPPDGYVEHRRDRAA